MFESRIAWAVKKPREACQEAMWILKLMVGKSFLLSFKEGSACVVQDSRYYLGLKYAGTGKVVVEESHQPGSHPATPPATCREGCSIKSKHMSL